MNLQGQISLINNPQDFTRLCNAVLSADHGTDFLAIDDDRSDRGNDGYIKSEKRLIAVHCFKRLQNQSIDSEIRKKVFSDFKKAIELKNNSVWDIERWTFICNYPINEATGSLMIELGKRHSIDVSWLGPEYFASILQKAKSVRLQFPNLQVNEVMEKLDQLRIEIEKNHKPEPSEIKNKPITQVPRTYEDQQRLLQERPDAWEYLYFGSILFLRKEKLELKWHDFEIRYAPKNGLHFDSREGLSYLFEKWHDLSSIFASAPKVFTPELQEKAFGPIGSPGDATRIEHMANHAMYYYDQLLGWTADLRGASIPRDIEETFEIAAQITEQPVRHFRDFVDNCIAQIDRVPAHIASEHPVGERHLSINLEFLIELDDDLLKSYTKLVKKVKKKIKY